jgi:putative ABC transport system substrate-binding protein
MGLVQSYARPGRNITGAALTEPGWWTGKAMQSLKQLAPRATRLAYLYPWPGPRTLERLSGSPIDVDKRIVDRARSAGFDARVFASSRTDAGPVFAEIKRWGVHAVFSPMVNVPYARQVAELALRFKLPSGFLMREAVEAGGLVSYGMRDIADERIAAELAASYIDRILRGANPATLPVELAMRYELVINAKTADALGLLIPAALRVSAEIVG